MNTLIEDLKNTNLFSDMEPQEIEGLLRCLCTERADYARGEYIVKEGSRVRSFSIILSGHCRAIKWDPSGRLIIISLLKKGSEIGVILAASRDRESPVTVEAQDEVSVLKIPFERVFTQCEKACPGHGKFLRNYIHIVAEKGLLLHERMDCLLRPTVREKILSYLWRISREQKSKIFSLPINRNAMAEYLNVDRSALSRELSYMKRDGIIDYYKNTFRLM